MAEALFERHPLPWMVTRYSVDLGYVIVDGNSNFIMPLSGVAHPQLGEAIVRMSEMADQLRALIEENERLQARVQDQANSIGWWQEEAKHWETKAVDRAAEMQRLEEALAASRAEVGRLTDVVIKQGIKLCQAKAHDTGMAPWPRTHAICDLIRRCTPEFQFRLDGGKLDILVPPGCESDVAHLDWRRINGELTITIGCWKERPDRILPGHVGEGWEPPR